MKKMKKFIALLLSLILMSTSVLASDISVNLDGEEIIFTAQEPVIAEGRTLIPLRGVFEKLGYEISWDNETKTASFKNDENIILVTAGSAAFVMNSEAIPLDVPATIINGSMMLPLRAVGEAAGLVVNWDNATKTVSLSTSGEAPAEVTTEAAAETPTEETTEAVSEETTKAAANAPMDIPAADLEKLKNGANGQSVFFETHVLMIYFYESVIYVQYKLSGALEFSYSEDELKTILTDALAECDAYKAAANSIKTTKADKFFVSDFIDYVDAYRDYCQFNYNYFCTDMFEKTDASIMRQKIKDLTENLNAAHDKYYEDGEKLADSVDSVTDIKKYNGVIDWDNLPKKDKDEINKYYKEIAEVVNSELEFINEAEDATENGSLFVNAAAAIRQKINTTPTPQYCCLDRLVMLCCCDLIDQTGKAIKNGAYTKDGKNQAFLEFKSAFITTDILFGAVLGDEYGIEVNDEEYEKVAEEAESLTV